MELTDCSPPSIGVVAGRGQLDSDPRDSAASSKFRIMPVRKGLPAGPATDHSPGFTPRAADATLIASRQRVRPC
jgi:hypothetical protein